MNGPELRAQLDQAHPDALVRADMLNPGTLRLVVRSEQLVPVCKSAWDGGARFVISVGTDRKSFIELTHVFSYDKDKLTALIKTELEPDKPKADSLATFIEGAGWAERECQDMLGMEFIGHPDPRRLVLPDDWPADVHPLRKDVPADFKPAPAPQNAVKMKDPEGSASVFPIGPFYPVLEEPVYFRAFVEGEQIVGCDYRGFYTHRGIEKLSDTTLTYNQVPFIAERICGICGFIHSTSYCQAVENAAGLEAPARARYIRSMLLELERIHSHLLWLGIAGHIIGFDTVLMQAWRIREPVMWLCEQITGNRKTYGMNLVGGVRRDISDEQRTEILKVVDKVQKQLTEVINAIIGDTTLRMRLERVGVLTPETARNLCAVGPTVRGSGVGIDSRVDHPYAAYAELQPKVITAPSGDVWGRTIVRLLETGESIRLVHKALETLPTGPIMADFGEIPPWREGISYVEAPRGEAIHYVLTGPDNRPYRWRVRAPSYANLQAIPAMLKGNQIADGPIIIGSIDPCFSCTDRLEVADTRDHTLRVYSRDELRALARKG